MYEMYEIYFSEIEKVKLQVYLRILNMVGILWTAEADKILYCQIRSMKLIFTKFSGTSPTKSQREVTENVNE